ncbi:VWA domain-containing protein [Paenibacillus albiflavus]|uniref:VWA domain-containing protein n=1 Tax=Paenibacillus albiflavus TaxID=2545760 RepID=A0A4R4E401_9BACL|nr:VWA domain-containing protein [Paenibacillus albiflavus]TCZ73563.1 VWA domain-containing protein [Paenibacillus albiflavus]
MGIQFDHPWVLLLLLLIVPIIVFFYKKDQRLNGFRKKLVFTLRTLLIVLLILAIAGMQTFVLHKEKQIVYVIDRSDSMPEDAGIRDWLKQSVQYKKENDQFAVISTGLEAVIERSMTNQPSDFSPSAKLSPQFSNLEQGLQVASSLLSNPEASRIVLVTDGEENIGSAQRQARMLKDRGVPIDVLQVPRLVTNDVAIESLKLPEKLYQAEKFAFEVAIRSTIAGTGELRIYEDNRELAAMPVEVSRGENQFVLQSLAKTTGLHQYRAEIYMDGDKQAVNNVGYAFSKVIGSPKVLIVEGKPNLSSNITAALESGIVEYEIIAPEVFPHELAKLTAYDSIILNDVSADRFSGLQMEMIEKAVSSYGIGLMMVGGEDSFGMGGYYKTPIEKALPVRMELEGKREIPSLGLILVIDRSGSMSGDKIELAKESAMRTVELMRAKDTVGVVAFDSQPWWVVEPQKLTDKNEVINKIKSIQSQGGTEIYPALKTGYDQLKELSAQRKHMILLTDGQSGPDPGYQDMLKDMTQHQITLSTVGIGQDTDVQFLEWLAKEAKGRAYQTNDQSTLPAIFSREAVMMARSYIVNQPFIPAIATMNDWSQMFVDGVPSIQAYVATTAKEAAESILVSPEPDPLLVRWQYGSGRSVAWTSDLTGKWSKDWIEWGKFSQVFTQMVKWTFPQFVASPYDVNTVMNGNEISLHVTATDSDAVWDELKAVVTDDKLNSQEVLLTQTTPGEYKGSVPLNQSGAYVINLTPIQNGSSLTDGLAGNIGIVVPYSPEYRIPISSGVMTDQAIAQLTKTTEGRMLSLDQPEQVFAGETVPSKQLYDLGRLLLILALMLWLLDIAVRRLSIRWESVYSWALNGYQKRQAVREAQALQQQSAQANRIERLQQRKQQTDQFYGDRRKKNEGGPIPNLTDESLNKQRQSQEFQQSKPRAAVKSHQGEKSPRTEDRSDNTVNRLLAAKQRKGR